MTTQRPLRVAVVGSGPAGFYAAGHLLAAAADVEVDGVVLKEGERLWLSWAMANRVPVVSKASNVDLGMVCSCVSVAGLGATTSGTLATLAPGSAVAVVG